MTARRWPELEGPGEPTEQQILRLLAELWRDQLALGTTQGGGRSYAAHCAQHLLARQLLDALDLVSDPDDDDYLVSDPDDDD